MGGLLGRSEMINWEYFIIEFEFSDKQVRTIQLWKMLQVQETEMEKKRGFHLQMWHLNAM